MRRKKSKSARKRPTKSRRVKNPHRRVLAGKTYLITKKCSDDLFLIRPSDLVNCILLYLLALKATRYGLRIHGFCFMANHFHIVLTDERGTLPEFMREFLGESSKAIQMGTKVDRPVWSRKRYSYTDLLDLDAAERSLVYTILNPTRAGLTDPWEWPGLNSANFATGASFEVKRPNVFFSKRRPKAAVLTMVPIALSFDSDSEASERRIVASIGSGVESCKKTLEAAGRSFMGADKAKQVRINQRGKRRVGHLNPRFSTKDDDLMKKAKSDWRQFEAEHEKAKRRFIAGERNVVFPAGTYGYKMLLEVRVAKEGTAA